MPPLPDDVLLVIFGHTDIDTFLDVRRLNHHVHALVQSHIHGLTESVARSTFPGQTKILENVPDNETASPADCLYWLKDLRFQQLAAILLEHNKSCSIAAEDSAGDDVRHAFARGWRVLARCSSIASDVYRLRPEELWRPDAEDETAKLEHNMISLARLQELEICRRWLKYLGTLPLDELREFEFLRHSLSLSVFHLPDLSISRVKGLQQPAQPDAHTSACWVSNHALKIGPQPFWQTWWSARSNLDHTQGTVKAIMEAALNERDEATRLDESQKVAVIKHHILKIITRLRGRHWNPSSEKFRIAKEMQQLSEPPVLYDLAARQDQAVLMGRALPALSSGGFLFSQELDRKYLKWTIVPQCPSSDPRGRPVAYCGGNFNHDREIFGAAPEYQALYKEWEAEWQQSEGWEKQIAPLMERLALGSRG
ncbi:hypothetical protein LTR17_005761 [Elasticomyces elasticus]|nr:hypothetical protein LTR17_005761 [Elasticomyces elasticus]